MAPVAYANNSQCEQALAWTQLVDGLEIGLKRFSNGEIEQPIRKMLEVKEHSGFLGLMPCRSNADNIISVKLVSLYPGNNRMGLPSHIVYVCLFDATTGVLKAVMEGDVITERRTAAASATSARWLAPRQPKTLAVLGSGHQAKAHIEVLMSTYGDSLQSIHLWNHRQESAERLKKEVGAKLEQSGLDIKVFASVQECVAWADLVVSATFASKPVLKEGLKEQGCHIMAVGAPRPDWAEIDPLIWQNSLVYVDSFAGAKQESGDLIASQCAVQDEIGNFIGQGQKYKGSKRTAFKSLGLAVEDMVAAKMVYEKIDKSGMKLMIDILDGANISSIKQEEKPVMIVHERTSNRVENLACDAFLLNSDLVVCELTTNAMKLALVYKAQTGELKAIADMTKVLDEEERHEKYQHLISRG